MSLAKKTIGGFTWAFGERLGIQLLQMVVFIILARVLTPKAFGLMGMLAVFIAVSQSLTDSGFGQALIQKKETDEIDYSSVFFINLVVSVLLYGILFLTAPLIASFYGEPILIDLLRVLGLKFIISAFSMVQIAKMTKEIKFKKLMIAKLPSTLLGGSAGIGAAYMGYGVWSLIIQQLTDATAYSIQIWIRSKWRPTFVFQLDRVKTLFDFGSKMMLSGILNQVSNHIYEILIGRFYSTAQVGYYSQANKLKELPVQNISKTLSRVTFPVLSEIQNDDVRLKRAYKKILRLVIFIVAPLMIGGIALAKPLFSFVLTKKWLPAVPYFQWLCVAGLFYPISAYNLNILLVKGKSDLFLKLGIIKKIIEAICLFFIVSYSVLALVIFRAVFGLAAYFINSYFSGILIDYGVLKQLKDICNFIFASLIMGFIIYLFTWLFALNDLTTLLVGIVIGIFSYGIIIYFIEYNILHNSMDMITELINKKKV